MEEGANELDSEQVSFDVILPAGWLSEKRYVKTILE
jgi:hypothetical protein